MAMAVVVGTGVESILAALQLAIIAIDIAIASLVLGIGFEIDDSEILRRSLASASEERMMLMLIDRVLDILLFDNVLENESTEHGRRRQGRHQE